MSFEKQIPCLTCTHGSMCSHRSEYEMLLNHNDDIMCRVEGADGTDEMPAQKVKVFISHRFKNGPALDQIYEDTFGKHTVGIHGCNCYTGANCYYHRWYTHIGSIPHGSILFRELNPAVPAYCAQVDRPGAVAWSMLHWNPICGQCKLKGVEDPKGLAASLGGTGFAEFDSETIEVPIGTVIDPTAYTSEKVPSGYVHDTPMGPVEVTEEYQTIVVLWKFDYHALPDAPDVPDELPDLEDIPTIKDLVESGLNHALYVYMGENETTFGDGVTENTAKIVDMSAVSGQHIKYKTDAEHILKKGDPIKFGAPIMGYTTRTADPCSLFEDDSDTPKLWKGDFTPKDGDTGVAYSLYKGDKCSISIRVPPGYRLATEYFATANPFYCQEKDGRWAFQFVAFRRVIHLTPDEVDPGIVCDPIDKPHNDAIGVGGSAQPSWQWEYVYQLDMGDEDIFLPLYLVEDVESFPPPSTVSYYDLTDNGVMCATEEEFHVISNESSSVWNYVIPILAPTYPTEEEVDLSEFFMRPFMKRIGLASSGVVNSNDLNAIGPMVPGTDKIYCGSAHWKDPDEKFQKMLYEFDADGFYRSVYTVNDEMDGAFDLSTNRFPIQMPELGVMPIEEGPSPSPGISKALWFNLPYEGKESPIDMMIHHLELLIGAVSIEPAHITIYNLDPLMDSGDTRTLVVLPADYDLLSTDDAFVAQWMPENDEEGAETSYQYPLTQFICYDSESEVNNSPYMDTKMQNMLVVVTNNRRDGIVGRPNYAAIPFRIDFPPKKLHLEVSVPEIPADGEHLKEINDIRIKGIGENDLEHIEVTYDDDINEFVITGENACFYEIDSVTYVEEVMCDVRCINLDRNMEYVYHQTFLLPTHKSTNLKITIPEFATVHKITVADDGGVATPYIRPEDDEPVKPTFEIGSGVIQLTEGDQGNPWDIFFNVENPVRILVYVSEFNDDPTKYCARCKDYIKTKQYEWLTWVPDCKDYSPNC